MKIEIITTGDEVVSGVIADTNSAWISEKVWQLGHEVLRHTSVGDDLNAIGEVLKGATKRADVVIMSGGLGPTADDITIEAAATAFEKKLVVHEEVLGKIHAFFTKVGRPMSPSNEKQAQIPEGGIVLDNRVGTAPGIQVRLGDAEVFFLPGVPKELYQIFDDFVMPWLAARAKDAIAERVLRCFGIPEATIDEKLKGVDLCGTRLSFRVRFPEILLKVVARSKSLAEAKAKTDFAVCAIREKLEDVVYGEGETSLAEVVGELLRKNRMTLAICESCTGGLLASLITDVPGSSEYFDRGIVAYSNTSKMELAGVSKETLRAHGAVSCETALAMAEGVKKISGASIGVGITGIAGPGGGTPEKPVGTVHIAVATPDKLEAHEYHINRDRTWFKQIVAAEALNLIRKHLL